VVATGDDLFSLSKILWKSQTLFVICEPNPVVGSPVLESREIVFLVSNSFAYKVKILGQSQRVCAVSKTGSIPRSPVLYSWKAEGRSIGSIKVNHAVPHGGTTPCNVRIVAAVPRYRIGQVAVNFLQSFR